MPIFLLWPLVAGVTGLGGGYVLGLKTSNALKVAAVLLVLYFAYKNGLI